MSGALFSGTVIFNNSLGNFSLPLAWVCKIKTLFFHIKILEKDKKAMQCCIDFVYSKLSNMKCKTNHQKLKK